MPSTSRGPNLELPNSMRPIRRPPPRMAAFAVPSTSRNPDEQPSAKRRQIETRQKQLDSLKKIENRYKNLQREEAEGARAKEPKLSNNTPSKEAAAKETPKKQCPCHKLSMFVLDIRYVTVMFQFNKDKLII